MDYSLKGLVQRVALARLLLVALCQLVWNYHSLEKLVWHPLLAGPQLVAGQLAASVKPIRVFCYRRVLLKSLVFVVVGVFVSLNP